MKSLMSVPESAVEYLSGQIERIRSLRPPKKIVFPEGSDKRILEAAGRLAKEGILQPVVLGSASPPLAGVQFIDPPHSPLVNKYASLLRDRRRAKGMTAWEAAEAVQHPLYFANLMVAAGDADGCVASAAHTTAESVRAALHCVEMKLGFRRLSSVHIMAVPDRAFGQQGLVAFSDAAINPDPSPVELSEIAIATAENTRAILNAEPQVALLSFSTKGSARHRHVTKVVEALRYIRARAPELQVDGELQADAALVPAVAQAKAPGSPLAGRANTLIFPDLNSANIGYKLVERLAGGALLAVVLQGLARPTNIVSRGCSAEDVYHTAILTAVQAARAGR